MLRPYCQRAIIEAWAAGFAKDSQEVPAHAATRSPARGSALVDLSSQPREGDRCLRLLRRSRCDVSPALCACDNRARIAPARVFERDRSSDSSLVELKSPPHSPKANAICERVIGTIRRECRDWLIPLSASHMRSILSEWVTHYNRSRPHLALGPGVPDSPPATVRRSAQLFRHQIGVRLVVRAKSVLAGLHHEYQLDATGT